MDEKGKKKGESIAAAELEPQQYRRLYWESDIPVKDIRHKLLAKLILFSSLIAVLTFILAAVVKLPDQVSLPFVLMDEHDEVVYSFPFKLFIQDRYVVNGQSIKSGDSLLLITAPQIVELLQTVEEADFEMLHIENFQVTASRMEQEMLQKQIEQNGVSIQNLQSMQESNQSTWMSNQLSLSRELEAAEDRLNASEKLFEAGVMARLDLISQRTEVVRLSDALLSAEIAFKQRAQNLKSEKQSLLIENLIAASRIKQLDYLIQADSSRAVNRQTLAKENLQKLFGPYEILPGGILLRSPLDGVVSYTFEGGSVLNEVGTLIRLQPNNMNLYAFTKCPPSVRGKLKSDMKVHLKVNAFPFYEWGTVSGYVSYLSTSPDEDGNYNLAIDATDEGKLKGLLQKGFTGEATIVLEERTLLEYIFRNFKRVYHQLKEGKI